MKKLLCVALSVLMVLTMIAGCGQKNPGTTTEPPAGTNPPAQSGEEGLTGTLSIALWDLDTQPAFSALLDAFKAANPGVEIVTNDIPSADYPVKLSTMLNGGSDVDVFWIKNGDDVYPIAERGQMVDLSSYIAADGLDLAAYNGLAEYFNIDGKQVALPYRSDYYLMYYNKDIFDEAGVAYPSNDMTWAEFEELSKQLTSGEGVDKKYGAHFHTWQALVQNWAVQDGKNTILATDYSFMKPYYEMILRMQNDDKTIMDYGTLKTGNISYNSVFPDGSVAMMPMGSWFTATMLQKVAAGETSVNWGIATCPHPEGVESGYVVGSTTPLAINAASKNQALAWEFVKFACGPEGAAICAGTGAIPGCLDDAALDIICGVEGMPEGAKEAMAVVNFSLDRPIAAKSSEVNSMLGSEHALIMLGEATIDDTLASMAEQSASIQAE